jgi:formylglycine-generating enzyme required for sulfatase activity
VIRYELLTGQRPLRGSTPRILAQILTQEPASPSSLRPGIDRELEQICQTAMARSIADRYPSMTSMAEALAAWLARHRLAVAGNGGLETTPAEPKCDLPKWPDAPSQGAPRTGKATQRKWTAASPGHDRWKAVLLAFAIGVLASELRRIFVGPPGPGSDRSQRPSAAIVGSEPVIRPAPGVAFVRGKNSVGMDLVRIEPGEYPMGSLDIEGSDEERPQHRVVITRPFLLGVCEVTVPQYRAVVDDDPTWLRDPEPIPMTNVDWFDAVRFCNRLSVREGLPPYYRISGQGGEPDVAIIRLDGPGYRLATEAEWEYACRAGSAHRHPAGRDDATLARYAWYNANSGKQVHPVSQKLPNAWGFCDMLGNAWEWCQDGYAPTYYQLSPTTDPPGPPEATRRVMRGGSIFDDYFCRSAARQGHPPGTRMAWLGFRVAAFTR